MDIVDVNGKQKERVYVDHWVKARRVQEEFRRSERAQKERNFRSDFTALERRLTIESYVNEDEGNK